MQVNNEEAMAFYRGFGFELKETIEVRSLSLAPCPTPSRRSTGLASVPTHAQPVRSTRGAPPAAPQGSSTSLLTNHRCGWHVCVCACGCVQNYYQRIEPAGCHVFARRASDWVTPAGL